MNRVLLILGGLLVGLLAALFIVPAFVDWTRYRGAFEEEATRLLGRDVRVGGRVNMRLLPSPFIRFEKVRVADTKATVGEPLFRAEDFTLWLAIGPLLSGELQASEVELNKPVVTLVLDEDGGGNWSSLAERSSPGSSAFAPSSVALENVRITNGQITILNADGGERTRLEHINGEVSASALEGPYRVTAAFAHRGAARELRLATAKADGDGGIRFKGAVRAPQSGASFTLDGIASDVFKKLALQGELTAKLPLAAIASSAPLPGGTPSGGTGSSDGVYDLKAQVAADTSGAELKDIALSFEQDGKPQIAIGSGRVGWRERAASSFELSSRWLDLDRIGAREQTTPMHDVVNRFLSAFDQAVPAVGHTTFDLALDQATIGGEIASNLKIRLERRDGPLAVKAAAVLPGGARFESAGIVTPANANSWYSGDISLRGTSLQRFSSWALRNVATPALKQDGAFQVAGRLTFGSERMSGRDIVAQLGGNNVTGTAAYGWAGGGRQLNLSLEGSELDISPFIDDRAGPIAAVGQLVDKFSAVAGKPAGTDSTTMQAQLRIGQLTTGRSVLRDVEADISLAGNQLTMPLLRFGSEDSYFLELRGDIAGLLMPNARGSIVYLATARSPADVDGLMELVDPGPLRTMIASRVHVALPARLAGRVTLGDTAPGSLDISADGKLGPTRVAGSMKLQRKGDGWRDAAIDGALQLDGDEAAAIVALFSGDAASTKAAPVALFPAQLSWRSVGTAKGGLVSLLSLTTKAVAGEYRGQLTIDDSAQLGLDGIVRLTSTDAGRVLAEFGAIDRGSLAGLPVAGSARMTGNLKRLKLDDLLLVLGSARLGGRLELDQAEDGRRLSGALSTDKVNLPAVLSALAIARAGPAEKSPKASAWSDDPLDLAVTGSLTATVGIQAAELMLAPEIAVRNAKLELQSKPGRVALQLSEATALAGKLAGVLTLEKAAAGARAVVDAKLTGGKLDALASGDGRAAASGGFALSLNLESASLSLRGLVAGLRGKGELKLQRASAQRLSPKSVQDAAQAFLLLKDAAGRTELLRLLQSQPAGGSLVIGDRTAQIEIADGLLKFAPIAIDAPTGRVTGTTFIDAEALRFDSEWRIEAAPTEPNAPSLPAVAVVYAGPLQGMGRIEPRLDVDALERELTVRRMERDLAELERLRQMDEERAKIESERLKALDAERLRRLQELPAAAPPPIEEARRPEPQIMIEPLPMPLPIERRPAGAQQFPPVQAEPPPMLANPRSDAVPPATPVTASPASAPPIAGPEPPPVVAPVPKQAPRQPPPPRRDVFRELGQNSP